MEENRGQSSCSHTKHLWTMGVTIKKGHKIVNVWEANSGIDVSKFESWSCDKCHRDNIWQRLVYH